MGRFHDNPRQPVGSDAFYAFQLNTYRQQQRRLIGGNGVSISRGLRGDIIRVNVPQSGSSSKSQFRGEYNSDTLYNSGDEVVVATGPNQGTYVYINPTASSSNDPWVGGGYWLQKPGGLSNSWM